jgi:hypothetical protein
MRLSKSFSISVLAAIMLLVSIVPSINAQARPMKPAATPPAANSPSLEETLKWITEFLPRSTGAIGHWKGGSGGYQETSSIQVIEGCRVSLKVVTMIIKDLSRPSERDTGVTDVFTFSLSDIDQTSVAIVNLDLLDVPNTSVSMRTDNGLKTVITDVYSSLPNQGDRSAGATVGLFVDSGSADRVVKAFKHAASLCAKTQPF